MLCSSVYLRVFALFETLLHIQAIGPILYYGNVPKANHVYYRKCAPRVYCNPCNKYRTFNGRCNNLENPLWGSTNTPYIRLVKGVYSDGVHAIRRQIDGSMLPGPRELQLKLFLGRSRRDIADVHNYHMNQFGQWLTHDCSMLVADDTAPKSCCEDRTPYQCHEVIDISTDDPVYSKFGQTCMEFKRAMTSSRNHNCYITPQIPMNQATAFIDASQLYGHTPEKAASLRTFIDGKLITKEINGQSFNPIQERNGTACAGRDRVAVCFDGGDPRLNQHFGLTLYHTMFTKFHNYLADQLKYILPRRTDEFIYQETRRIIGAANQIIAFRDYLPILLGKQYTDRVNLGISSYQRTPYDPLLMPQLSMEFVGSAFRVPHNILPRNYNFMDINYTLKSSVKLNEWMSKPDPIIKGSNFDDILRGMTDTAGRGPAPSYNFLISNFMFHNFTTGYQDLLSVDIQRGRDTGVPTYITMRQLCGFPKVSSFKDLRNVISIADIRKLQTLYASVDDVDLLVGALLEPPCPGAMVGPTARCIITDVFTRLRFGDSFFFDVPHQPGTFRPVQLNALSKIDLGHVFCAGSGINEVPIDIFESPQERYSENLNCKQHLASLDFSAWSNEK